MPTPYSSKPDSSFWRKSVVRDPIEPIDPVTGTPFTIAKSEAVATAGSCFAQHISHALKERDCTFMITEPGPRTAVAIDEQFGVYPARFGNIYSVRQLLQLMLRAYGLFHPDDRAWPREDGRFVDPFRPLVQAAGFESMEAVEQDRDEHLAAVRTMFEECDVFVFTLGLTERWEAIADGAVFPLVPQSVACDVDPNRYRFVNATVHEMTSDLDDFIDRLRLINPSVKIILTVSPVPLIATFEPSHVLVSNAYSKAALRVVAEATIRAKPAVAYFPSYEIITAPHLAAQYYADDLREVRPEGVHHAISIFARHYLDGADVSRANEPAAIVARTKPKVNVEEGLMRRLQTVICDEEVIEGTR